MRLEKKKIAVILCLSHLVFSSALAQLKSEKITTRERDWICKKDIWTEEMGFSMFVETMGDFCERLTDRCSNAYQSSDTCFDLRFEAWYNKVSNSPSTIFSNGERFVDSSYGFQNFEGELSGEKFNQIDSTAKRFLRELKSSESTKSLCCEMYSDKEDCERDFNSMNLSYSSGQRLNRINRNNIILPYSDLVNCETAECVNSAVLAGALDYCAQKSGAFDLENKCDGTEDKFKNLLTSLGNNELNNCLTSVESAISNSEAAKQRKIGTCRKYTYYKAYLSVASLSIYSDIFIQKRNLCRNQYRNKHLSNLHNISDLSSDELVAKINAYSDIDLVQDPLGSLISQCLFETTVKNNSNILNKLCIDKSSCVDR